MAIKNILWDLGGVLIDWDPKYVYRTIFDSEAEVENFLATICTSDWNEEQDAGRTIEEGNRLLIEQHPDYRTEIEAFYGRWTEMLGGPIESSVDTLRKINLDGRFNQYSLTNWSFETFPIAIERYSFLKLFGGIVVSGIEKCRKPDPKIYQIVLDRFSLTANETLFIDDNLRNIKAAAEMGFETILYSGEESLDLGLKEIGVI